ncbi:SDR family oxidoreductase [Vicingaceae bacterium]|nr:SDR family oxidoreductase [Vicingaceae bacterium]
MSKTYLIVGGTSGIGNAIVKQLSAAGNHVIVASREEKNLEGFANVTFQKLDVNESIELDLPESIDGLAYCPGSINLKPFHRIKEEDFLAEYQLNAMGAVKVIQHALPKLKKADNASIVLFSTVAVQTGLTFHTSVAMAKGALEGLGRALASELAPKIRVNLVAPSLTDTPLANSLLSSDEKRKANADRHPLKKIGTTEDIANAAMYLLTDQSSWMTGQVLHIDGGMSRLK